MQQTGSFVYAMGGVQIYYFQPMWWAVIDILGFDFQNGQLTPSRCAIPHIATEVTW